MATPHKGDTQRGKRVLSLGGLFCGASGTLPTSWVVSFGVFTFLGTEVKGLAAVCGPSRTGTNPRTGRTVRRYPRAQLREYVVFGSRHRDIVGGRFCGCPRQALRYTDRPTRLWSPCWRVALSGLSVLSGQLFSWYSTALGDSVFPYWLLACSCVVRQ